MFTAPVIETVDDSTPTDIDTVARYLIEHPPELLIVQTGQGLQWWTDRLSPEIRSELLNRLGHSEIWSRGAKSTSRCRSLGLEVDWQSPSETASEIALRCQEVSPDTRVAVQLVGTTNDLIVDALQDVQADVTTLRVYRYRIPKKVSPILSLIDAVIAGGVDAITFTASPAILHLRTIAKRHDLLEQLDAAIGQHCAPIVVGPVCASTASDAGWSGIVEPETARLMPMLDALTSHFTAGAGALIEDALVLTEDFTILSSND